MDVEPSYNVSMAPAALRLGWLTLAAWNASLLTPRGDVAQRESTAFATRGSRVQIPSSPPMKNDGAGYVLALFCSSDSPLTRSSNGASNFTETTFVD